MSSIASSIKALSMGEKIAGKIVYWNDARGFGFVRRVNDGVFEKYFLHISDIMSGTPKVDAVVRFHVRAHAKGLSALNAEVFDDVVSALGGGK